MIVESWKIASEHLGRRWWWVKVHDTSKALARAAHRHQPHNGWEYWRAGNVLGCVQGEAGYEWVDADPSSPKNGQMRWPVGGYAGIIRLCSEHLYPEVIYHELLHAACCVYRMNVARSIDLGTGFESLEREEDLAYILGQLASDMSDALRART